MLNPPSGTTKEAFIAAIRSGSPVHMRFTQPGHTTITDADFHENGLIFRDILNSDTDLTIGKSVKKEIAFKLIGVSPSINFNAEFTAEIGVEINGSTVWVTLGKFTAVYPDNYVDEHVSEYVAYDRMSRFDVPADEWLKSLTYPMTVQQMFESLCSYVGLTGEIGNALTNMKNRSFSTAPIQNLGLMCRDVLELIAEACGCYAVITNEGNCKLKWYSIASYTEGGSTVRYTVSGDEIFDRKQKNYLTMVSGLNVKQAEDDVGVLYPSTATDDIYVIVDNPFLVTADSTEEDNYIVPLYNRLRNGNVMHYPIEVTCVGNPLIEAGDIIYANTNGSTTMWFPIYVKEMHWNGSLTDVYYSTGSIHRQSYTSAIKQKLSQGGRYHIFKNTVDQLYSELYDPTTGDVSILNQTAQALGLSANGIDIVGGKYVKILSGGTFLVEATNFKIDSANRIFQTGNWKMDADELTFVHDIYSIDFAVGLEVGSSAHRMGIDVTAANEIAIFNKEHMKHGKTGKYSLRYGCYDWINSGVTDEYISLGLDGYIGWQTSYISRAYITDIYGTLHSASSREKKHDIEEIPDMGEAIDRCTPVSFAYNDDESEKTHYGLIYEDTEDIVPVVCENTDGLKNINYVELVPVLLKEIQSLRKRVASLENPTN